MERLGASTRNAINEATSTLSKNSGLQLTFAFPYGSRSELVSAASHFAEDCINGKYQPKNLNEELFSKYLWTSSLNGLSDVDLIIRTGGEHRTSNFLLWQSAYAEYIFFDDLWPDFTPRHLQQALELFSQRHRRFGKV